MNLDYCEVMTITGDYSMTIITLDNLYSLLSRRLTPLDVVTTLRPSSHWTTFTPYYIVGSLLSMLCPCCIGDMQTIETHVPCLGHIFTGSGLKGTLGAIL
jgi:hypothetical protein